MAQCRNLLIFQEKCTPNIPSVFARLSILRFIALLDAIGEDTVHHKSPCRSLAKQREYEMRPDLSIAKYSLLLTGSFLALFKRNTLHPIMNILEQFARITTFVFDMDGVLTDGSLWIFSEKEYIRKMNIKDGYALQLAVNMGYRVAVITGSQSGPVKQRLNSLGITDVFQQVPHKREQLLAYMQQHELRKEEILYMGDDIPDAEVMQVAGLACCPADAVSEIRKIAHYISPEKGGEGCVRDVIEKTLKINGHWQPNTGINSI